MSKPTQFTKGQPILWINRRSKSGEPRSFVRGEVIRQTAKRVTIRVPIRVRIGVRKGAFSTGLCSVEPKYVLPDTLERNEAPPHR